MKIFRLALLLVGFISGSALMVGCGGAGDGETKPHNPSSDAKSDPGSGGKARPHGEGKKAGGAAPRLDD